jgi:penicillin-insensitive murein endopeptidase
MRWRALQITSRVLEGRSSKFTLLGATLLTPLLVGALASGAEDAPVREVLRANLASSFTVSAPSTALPPPRIADPEITNVSLLDDEAFAAAMADDLDLVGSMSIGAANRGSLFNGVPMPESERWKVEHPEFAFGTQETIDGVTHAINAVNDLFPDTPKLHIGHIARARGGWLSPHRSHQSGRDVDIGFYYRGQSAWYLKATAENFDVQRNWALLSALLKTSPIEYVFIDRSLQEALRAEAVAVGESPLLIRDAFDGIPGKTQPLVRHRWGHDEHMHVRFHSAVAVENAARARAFLGRKAWNRRTMVAMLSTRAAKQKKR